LALLALAQYPAAAAIILLLLSNTNERSILEKPCNRLVHHWPAVYQGLQDFQQLTHAMPVSPLRKCLAAVPYLFVHISHMIPSIFYADPRL
jgi:hypothetical protein